LHRNWQLCHLIEEKRPVSGALDMTDMASVRASERSAFVSE
jgi:hypothetical protein